MKELMLLNDDELQTEVLNIDRRRTKLNTSEGMSEASRLMLGVLRGIEAAGYEPKSDLADMAATWVMLMREQIAVYRFEGIKEAVYEFLRTDTREYKQFPSAGQIIEVCSRIGRNPRSELGRRRQAEFERQVDEERDREMAALPEEYKKACAERIKRLWKGKYEN